MYDYHIHMAHKLLHSRYFKECHGITNMLVCKSLVIPLYSFVLATDRENERQDKCVLSITPCVSMVPVPSSSSHTHPISAGGGGCGAFGSVPAFPDKGRETLVIRWADFLWLDLSWTNASFGSNPSSLRLMGFLNGLVSQRYPNWVCFIVLIHLLQTHFIAHVNNDDKPNQRIIQSRRGQSENTEGFFFMQSDL